MVAVGAAMLLRRGGEGDPSVRITPAIGLRLAGIGFLTGLLSGFFGIGGGFLVVPGLMLGSGMAILNAVGSSLLSVGAFGAATAANYAISGLVDWPVAGLFIAGGVAGGTLGMRSAVRLADRKGTLTLIFASVIFAVAAYMLYRSAGTLFAPRARPDRSHPHRTEHAERPGVTRSVPFRHRPKSRHGHAGRVSRHRQRLCEPVTRIVAMARLLCTSQRECWIIPDL